MMKRYLAVAVLLISLAIAGCQLAQQPGHIQISGTVQDIVEAMNWNALHRTWSAQLLVSPDYNGSPNVNIGNDGNSECVFRDFVHNGDHLIITIDQGGSFNELDVSNVQVNKTPLGRYSGGSC
jgi:hypothetical protein